MEILEGLDMLVVHHSASPSQTTTPEQIREWHLARGWDDVGYHWIVTADGFIHPGRPLPYQGAHAYGQNARSLGICLVGNNASEDPDEHWTAAQRTALMRFAGGALVAMPHLKIVGHRDIADGTECPGVNVAAWIRGPR